VTDKGNTDKETKRARFREVADQLRKEIVSGELQPGAQLPSVDALSARFSNSSATMNKAIALLEREGLVDIRHGAGAFVRDWKPILRDANRRLSAEQWGSGRPIWEVDLGDRVPVPEVAVKRTADAPQVVLDSLEAREYLVRDRRYSVGGRPVQIAVSYLDADLVAGSSIERRDTGPGGTYQRLAEMGHKPAWFREQVRSRLPDVAEAKRLKIGQDRPVTEVIRQAMTSDGRIVEVNIMLLVGSAYVLQYVFPS
jgi:GntR family transcriptional regulator